MPRAQKESQSRLREVEGTDNSCPTCGESVVIRDYQRNIEVCENCGRVLREGIKDLGPEWRAYSQEQRDQRSRAGPPSTETIHDKGLSTKISYGNRDSRGNAISPDNRSMMNRLRKWQRRSRISGAKDRNLATALSEIDRMSSQLGLPKSVREVASKIYREAVNKDLIRGRSIEGIASAVLYLVCRKNNIPRALEEVTEVSRVDKKEIGRSYRFLSRELDINLPPVDPAMYVSRFGSKLDVSGEVRTKAIDLIRKAQEEGLTAGKSPTGTAGAALYIASRMEGEKRTQKGIADATKTTEVTVRNRYKDMVEELSIDEY